MKNQSREFWLIILAFFTLYFVWGSTYLANAWGVKTVPPLLFSGSRFAFAGFLLLGFARLFGPLQISKIYLKNTFTAGFLLFTVGNGCVVWSLQYIDSGIAALIVAFEPLIVAMLLWQLKNKKPKRNTWIGILLGIFGMTLLVGQPSFGSETTFVYGVIAIMVALFAWGFVSIWIPDADLPESIMQSAAFQMIMGGVSLLVIGSLIGELNDLHFENIETTAIWSFAYLVIFGSILAFSSFNYLLTKVSPTKVVTSAYVNPVVAVILGWWLNGENLSTQSIIAATVLLTGVVFITRAKASKAS